MEKIYEQTMLFDFYGELLTEHQRSIYEDAVYNDMSLGEIAQERGISRQGVHDLIKRCDKILQEYESKLHLVERFAKAKATVGEIEKLTRVAEEKGSQPEQVQNALAQGTRSQAKQPQNADEIREALRSIRKLSEELLEEL